MSVGADLPIGTELAGYRIEMLVGRGGMGVVYRALDLALDRPVALKILAPELAADVGFRERFLRESRLAASIDHPNVIPVYDAGEVAGELYIAMRYVEGSDLKRLLTDGPPPKDRTLRIVSQVAAALDAAHARGLVHRDVKPSNVLVGDGDHVYLADFGLTRRLGEAAAALGADRSLGTADYISPEQIRGDDVDGRADLYSLGCLLHECLTGRPPFRRSSEVATLFAHLEEEPSAPPGLEKMMRTALAKEPDERFQSGRELVEAAERALIPAPSARSRRGFFAGAVGLLAIVGVGLGLLLSRGGSAAAAGPGLLVRIDPRTNTSVARLAVGRQVTSVAVGSRYVWVGSAGDHSVWRVGASTGGVLKIPTGHTPSSIAVSGRYVVVTDWLGDITAIDARTATLFGNAQAAFGARVAAGASGIWLAEGQGAIVGADPYFPSDQGNSGKEISLQENVRPGRRPFPGHETFSGFAIGKGALWVAGVGAANLLWRIDPVRARVVARIPLRFKPGAIAVDARAVWVISSNDTVARVDPKTNRVTASIPVGAGADSIAAGDDALWVGSAHARTVSRIDPGSDRVVATIPVDAVPRGIAVGPTGVWVAATPR